MEQRKTTKYVSFLKLMFCVLCSILLILLTESYYSGANSTRTHASEQTSYKWSFASKKSSADDAAIGAARRAVEAATKGEHPDNYIPPRPTSESSKSRAIGPKMPSREDTLLALEVDDERRLSEKAYKRKRDRVEDRERIEDLVGPKESGREGMLEKKRVKRDNDRSYRDAKDDAFGDYDDSTLMGGGDSFQARYAQIPLACDRADYSGAARIAQRDAARRRFEEKKASAREEKVSEVRERQDAMRQKEKATMDMFKQMAKERFG